MIDITATNTGLIMATTLFERARPRPKQLDEPPPNLMLVDPDFRSFDPYNSAGDRMRNESGPVEFVDSLGDTWIGDRPVCHHRRTKIVGREVICTKCGEPL